MTAMTPSRTAGHVGTCGAPYNSAPHLPSPLSTSSDDCPLAMYQGPGADLSGGGDGWNDEVSPVRLLALVFSGLSTTGFHVTFASDVAYRLSAGRDTVFLKQGAKVQRAVFAVRFRKPGTLLLVNAPMIVQNIFVTCLQVGCVSLCPPKLPCSGGILSP